MGKYAKLLSEARGDETLAKMEKGLRVARAAITESEKTSIVGLISGTDLPELGQEPLADLATRLDREADLWRNLAFREMAKMTTQSRVVTALAIAAALADIALAGVATLGAVFGLESAHRGALVFTAFVVVTLGLGAAAALVMLGRRAERELVRAALARADQAELRLHRVALVMAAKKLDEARYAEALARLERDAT